jgi:hypothetical protein
MGFLFFRITAMALLEWMAGNRGSRRIADRIFTDLGRRRVRQIDQMDPVRVQEETLLKLVRKASKTKFGLDHRFDRIKSVQDYQSQVPIRDYEAFWNQYWQSSYPRFEGVTWPDPIPYFALSSGTTSGTTKYIPISHEMTRSNRKAATTTMGFFRNSYPDHHILNGQFFFLGGSTELQTLPNGSLAGDLSGIAAIEINPLLRPYTFPNPELCRISKWEEKVEAFSRGSLEQKITAFSGVPAWMLVIFDRVKAISGKKTIAEAWPDLRLIVHGGTKFDPYRKLFEAEIGSDLIKYIEVYPCSEGFIATEDPRYKMLRIIPDLGIFFEFIPIEELGTERPTRHTLATAEAGVEYAVVVTTCAGLWSYIVGDTIEFESLQPPLIRFTGRTKYFLSAFGEHLINEEVEKAITIAAAECKVTVLDHHVGPIFPTDPKLPGNHRYIVEFDHLPTSLKSFSQILDAELSKLNEDYAAHRSGDLSMGAPEVIAIKPGAAQAWMLAHGKRPPQHKFPRMDNSGKLTASMSEWMRENNWIAG